MGSCQNKESIYSKYPHLLKWRPEFDALMVSEYDVGQLYSVFCEIDEDGSGDIDLAEMVRFLELQRTKFNKRIFTLFDEDGSGEVDFREFVIALWNYCTMGRPALTLFAFDLYDDDGSGELELGEIEKMLKEVYGKSYKTSDSAKRVMKKIEELTDEDAFESVSVKEFSKFCDHHPSLLFPAFKFQIDLCQKILGTAFWEKAALSRIKMTSGQNLTVTQLLKKRIQTNDDSQSKQLDEASSPVVPKGRCDSGVYTVRKPESLNLGTLASRQAKHGLSNSARHKIRAVGKMQRRSKLGGARSGVAARRPETNIRAAQRGFLPTSSDSR